ncbi:mitochondrial ribosomal protein L15 precursor, putative [Plasmodium chabaudi adami]|uniref:Mitochondrial ribosomal protein L15, putative n=1 Tax=Plasmodium chabaudi adami TaxID=5826 RepID=A0A1C6XQ91_PLACE|nr:mitochondrial ribosomal protein L15 precursor, putative [Plasmodium chabaudi adami]
MLKNGKLASCVIRQIFSVKLIPTCRYISIEKNDNKKIEINDQTNKSNINLNGLKIGKHFREMFHDGEERNFESHPFNRRFAYSKKSLFPIEPRNLRTLGLNRQRKKKRGRGDKCPGKGIRDKHKHRKSGRPNSRTFESGRTPLYRRLPKWPEAWLSRQKKQYEFLNLSKLRYFIEKGRLDTRFPITQRHLYDSKCVRVKNGVKLFNINDYPFPYKINIEVANADQSSIDTIKKVGGSITIIYMERVNLRAHIKPYKFEILPKTARPNLDTIHFLEKMRSRGCIVKYIKPLWLIEEEKRIINELTEIEECSKLSNNEHAFENKDSEKEDEQERRERLLQKYRLQNTKMAEDN